MKNIHVLPTSQPSRLLYFGTSKELTLQVNPATFRVFERNTQHIYITSDEEIKEGDWVIYNNKVFKIGRGDNELFHLGEKIILTTDQDLIKDGVQKIDDDFLEWFIKNPSCEEVEIRKEMYIPQSNGKISDGKITHEISLDPSQNTLPYYKIIIPKESKQKTLEKLAKEYYPDESKLMEMMERIAFKRGYTECKENSYREEDMKQFAFECVGKFLSNDDNKVEIKLVDVIIDRLNKHFEQFKKK